MSAAASPGTVAQAAYKLSVAGEQAGFSTRVRLKVGIEARGLSEPLTWEGETFVVDLHDALILTAVALRLGMKILIHVRLADKRATAGGLRRSRATTTLRSQAGET